MNGSNISNGTNGSLNAIFGEEYEGPTVVTVTKPPIKWIFEALVSAVKESGELSVLDWDRFGPVLTYCCSTYGLACLIMAFILNRTLILASVNTTRLQMGTVNRNLGAGATPSSRSSGTTGQRFEIVKKVTSIALRLAAIGTLLYNCFNVLVMLDFIWKSNNFDENVDNWFSRGVSYLLRGFTYSPDYYYSNKYMSTPKDQVQIGPTTDMYWPVFLGYCWLLFVETFISVMQGRKPYNEAGITIFEHSFAFHQSRSKTGFLFGGRRIHARPTEQVLICSLYLIANHLNIQIGGAINNNRYRLIPLTIFGASFMVYIYKSVLLGNIFEFSFVIISAFIPQFLFLGVIIICTLICSLAFMVNGFQLTNLNYASFFQLAEGEQETDNDDSQFVNFLSKNLNIQLSDDFYTSLLNLGTLMISVAGKSCYIKELGIVTVTDETWLEKSIWEKLLATINLDTKKHGSNSMSVFKYLKGKNISGYANLIKSPSERLLKGQSLREYELSMNSSKYDEHSVMKRRIMFVSELFDNLIQLFSGLARKTWRLIRRAPSDEKDIPVFLQRFIQPKTDDDLQSIIGMSKYQLVNVDDLDENELSIQLLCLKDSEFSEIDNSNDYFQEDYISEQLDIELDLELVDGFAFEELMSSPQEFMDLVGSGQELRYRMSSDAVMTRSVFNKLSQNENETTKLMELIVEKRRQQLEALQKREGEDEDEVEDFSSSRYDCVVCQVNPREIITWPCKCFAVCELCRLSLVTKGMEGCVCCRKNVEGVTRVFIP